MQHQVPVLAVDRDEVAGLHDAVHDLEFLARRVTADVDGVDPVVDDVGAPLEEARRCLR